MWEAFPDSQHHGEGRSWMGCRLSARDPHCDGPRGGDADGPTAGFRLRSPGPLVHYVFIITNWQEGSAGGQSKGEGEGVFFSSSHDWLLYKNLRKARELLSPSAIQQSHGWEKGGPRTTVHSLVHLTNICLVSIMSPAPTGDGPVNQSSRLHRDQSSPSNKQLKGQEMCGVGGHEHVVLEENLGEPWSQGGPRGWQV